MYPQVGKRLDPDGGTKIALPGNVAGEGGGGGQSRIQTGDVLSDSSYCIHDLPWKLCARGIGVWWLVESQFYYEQFNHLIFK